MPPTPEPQADPTRAAPGPPPAERRPTSFWRLLPRSFAYPLRGQGRWLILGGGVGMCLLEVAASFLPLAGWILGVLLLAYFAMHLLRNIGASAGGSQEPPDWPDIRSLDDTVLPLLQVLGTAALCLGPFAGYRVYLWVSALAGSAAWSCGLLAAGLFYLPMALLSVALRDSLAGASPLIVLPAIAKVFPAYLAALVAIAAACAMYYPIAYLAALPLVGSLVGALFCVYWLTAIAHIIGLIYRAYENRLGWFTEE